jgi:hypothetical protein
VPHGLELTTEGNTEPAAAGIFNLRLASGLSP